LNQTLAEDLAYQQMEWLVLNANATYTVEYQEIAPMLDDCPDLPPRQPATKISELHPQDVRVIGAVGDSVSTGCNSLSSSWLSMKDYQGISWSMGGDEGVVTMANQLGENALGLIGQAKGIGGDNKGYNYAKNGAIVQDTPQQAVDLVNAIKSNSAIDLNNDWKVVTVLIGGNNLCDVCDSGKEADNNAATYEKYLTQTLDTLSQLPRTYVNLVQHMDYTQLAKYKGPLCSVVLPFVCDCLTSKDSGKQAKARDEIVKFNEVISKLAPKYRRDDFAVVVHSMLSKSVVPDRSFISAADCFHPSGSGQRMFGTALWNSMIMNAQAKGGYIATADDVPRCAAADSLLYVE